MTTADVTTARACEDTCPESHFGNHDRSCYWTGTWFLDGKQVQVLGEQPGGGDLCIQYADGTGHRHVGRSSLGRVRFPDVTVHLSTGQDGNIFYIMGAVTRALKRAGHGDYVDDFTKELTDQESYDKSLQVVMRTVTVS